MNIYRRTLFVFFLLLLAGCEVESSYTAPLATPAGTSTPDPILLYAQAGSSQKTAQAAQGTADFFSSQLTATAQQHDWDATATWSTFNQTATQQTWNATVTADSLQATSTAAVQAAATGTAGAATQAALDVTATADWAAGRTYATAMAGQAASVELGIRRETITNQIKAFAPWVVTLIAFALSVLLILRLTRFRVISTGQQGDKPLLLDVVDGVATDMDLSVNPSQGLKRVDKQLPAPSPEVQAQAKMRDQAVDLGTRGTGPSQDQNRHRRAAAGAMNSAALPIPTRVTLLPSNQASSMVGDVIPAIVRDATGVSFDDKEDGKP